MDEDATATTALRWEPRSDRRGSSLAAGALVGCVVALTALDPLFILGTGGEWLRPANDFNAYLVAWHYFIADAWRFPLFSLPMMGYPEGGNLLFNDALPLTAIPTKLLFELTGARVNPLGGWIFLTYVLQGVMAARLVRAVGVRSVAASVGAAILAVCPTFFLWRLGHTALSSHFLILWALALYFESVRALHPRLREMWLLAGLTLLVNSYLFAMVMILHVTTLVARWRHGRLTWQEARTTVVGGAAVATIALVAGYGTLLVDPSSMRSGGYGEFSWNLVGLLFPVQIAPIRDATGGQGEGEAYIGNGALLLLLTCLLTGPRAIREHVRHHRALCGVLALLAVYAATNRVYFGSTLVLEYFLPNRVIALFSYFRGTGRFIWPLAYSLIVLPVALAFRWWRPAVATVVVAIAAVLQVQGALRPMELMRAYTAHPDLDLIDNARIAEWMQEHQRMWQYPSWRCGGLGPATRVFADDDCNRELQLQLLAARIGLPTNSVYSSRSLKSCTREATWADDPRLEPDVLYFLNRGAVAASPPLAQLAASDHCITLSWAIVCSLSFPQSLSR